MPVLRNVGRLATCRAEGAPGDVGLVERAALAWEDGTITWVGPEADLPARHRREDALDAGGRLVIPGLVDCHTHLAFGGWRSDEFADRIRGRSYLEIAEAGGGILSTVRATRTASEEGLLERCRGFIREMAALGITTVECKSGYGLDPGSEEKLLRVYRRLADEGPLRLVPTFLGAHVVPPEYGRDGAGRTAYVDLLVDEMIPAVARAGLASFVDVFVEDSAFTVEEARRILRAGRGAGLGRKLHADQLTDGGGARLAAEEGAISADHLECISDDGIRALAEAGTVAVTLPLATLYLDQEPPPARRLIQAGVPVAVATDFNPGTAPSYHLPFALTLACTRQRMTPAEALLGATRHAARAVGRADRVGSLEPGKAADFAVIDARDPDQWLYHLRPNACVATVVAGETVWRAPGFAWDG